MKKFNVTVHVFIKPAVLNPAEGPVLLSLHSLGFKAISKISMGKCFILTIETEDLASAEKQASEMCNKLLANLVVEHFQIVRTVEAPS